MLPLTPDGKVDRRRCRRRTSVEPARATATSRRATPIEQELAAIWEELLGVERVGVDGRLLRARRPLAARDADDHADPATPRARSAARALRCADGRRAREGRRRGKRIPMSSATDNRTVASGDGQGPTPGQRDALVETIRQRRDQETATVAIPKCGLEGPTPLSFSQQRMWFANQWEPGAPTFNGARAIRIRGPLDVDALTKSLTAAVARHEASAHGLHPRRPRAEAGRPRRLVARRSPDRARRRASPAAVTELDEPPPGAVARAVRPEQ